ncbi:hypothetical protein RCL1_002934 [Eukaryota sp. TZLM3-RCL]
MPDRNEVSFADIVLRKYPNAYFGGAWFSVGRHWILSSSYLLFLILSWLGAQLVVKSSFSLLNSLIMSLFISLPFSCLSITALILFKFTARKSSNTSSKLSRKFLLELFDLRLETLPHQLLVLLCIFSSSFAAIHVSSSNMIYSSSILFALMTALVSLLRMPEPEPSSPTYGYYPGAYSRSFFIIFFSSLYYLSNFLHGFLPTIELDLFTIHLSTTTILSSISSLFVLLTSVIPILCVLGLISSPGVFLHWLLEQSNMIVFGSSATSSLVGAFVSLLLSVLSVFVLVFIYPIVSKPVFFGVCTSICVLLARTPSNLIDLFCRDRVKYHLITLSGIFLSFFSFLVLTLLIPSSFFTSNYIFLFFLCLCSSFISQFIIPNSRQSFPFSLFGKPFIKLPQPPFAASITRIKKEFDPPTRIEKIFLILNLLDSCLFLPLFLISLFHVTIDHNSNLLFTALCIISLLKTIRGSMQNSSLNFYMLALVALLFSFDFKHFPWSISAIYETPLVTAFICFILIQKIHEIIGKSWFSLYSIGAVNPFGIILGPHSGFILFNKILSFILSSPLIPYGGSSFAWTCGYPRPIKFWTQDPHQDGSSRDPSLSWDDVRRLDGAFYEQLNASLSRSLSRDVVIGRLGQITTGDVMFLRNDRLNAFVHVIEKGLGYCCYQMRGLELKGTVCHNSELRALDHVIDEQSTSDSELFSGLTAFRFHLAKLVSNPYNVFAYNVNESDLSKVLGSFDFTSMLIANASYSLAFVLAKDPTLSLLSKDPMLRSRVQKYLGSVVTLGFSSILNDWDRSMDGVTFASFKRVYEPFASYCHVSYCAHKITSEEFLSCYYGICCILRYLLIGTATQLSSSNFLCAKFNSLFQGEFSSSESWITPDLKRILVSTCRFAFKLHCDYFIDFDSDFHNSPVLASRLGGYEEQHIICSEREPRWLKAINSEVPYIDSLRTCVTDGERKYSLLNLSLEYLPFALLKLNSFAVTGQWASSVHEVVFLGNEDSERMSIQSQPNILRNLTVSGSNPPTGYPLAVCSCTFSFS